MVVPTARQPPFALPSVIAAAVVMIVALGACEAPDRVITYDIATSGPVVFDVEAFADEVADILADPRGWQLGDAVAFRRVDGPSDLTIWLASPAEMPGFSPKCSSQWSCRVGRDVVINENRWRLATPAWMLQVPRYRAHVLNHEVGHWLGLGHEPCSGLPGEPAPVMAQQSKGRAAIGVCAINPWPVHSEIIAVARELGVQPRTPVLISAEHPIGQLEAAEFLDGVVPMAPAARVQGWALDGDTTAPIEVSVVADGVRIGTALADRPRPDLVGLFPLYGERHGFDAEIPVPADTSTLCVDAHGVGAGRSLTRLGCLQLSP